jgi:hypothetical protein
VAAFVGCPGREGQLGWLVLESNISFEGVRDEAVGVPGGFVGGERIAGVLRICGHRRHLLSGECGVKPSVFRQAGAGLPRDSGRTVRTGRRPERSSGMVK